MSNKLYTLKDWRNDHVLKIKIGQYVDYGVINQLMDGLPPLTYNDGIFQVGEPDDQNVKTGELLFKTFIEDGGYRYVGLCPEGSTVDETKDSYGYQRDINKNNIQENKKHMKITEKELHNLISECVQEVLLENEQEEGRVNQAKSAWSALTSKNGGTLSQRWDNMKKNFSGQKEIDDLRDIKEKLIKLIDARQINPNTTIAQLVGGKYNGNKFGSITGMEANRRAQIARRGGKHFE